jgi:hypothetical protein
MIAIVSAWTLAAAIVLSGAGVLFDAWDRFPRAWFILFTSLLAISAVCGLIAIRRSAHGMVACASAAISSYLIWITINGVRAL